MAKEQELSSDELKSLWLKQADAQFAAGNKAKARKMRRIAERRPAWNRAEKELRAAKANAASFDWSTLINALVDALLKLLSEWLSK